MVGIVIKKDGKAINKVVRFGNEDEFIANTSEDANAEGQTIDIYRDDDWTTFESITIDPPPSTDQEEWDAQKQLGPEAAIAYLAKKLGLQ
jgi:hypothetical protein